MVWTKNDYPESMKNLSQSTRNKAIEISNALVDEDYEEGRAIAIGISQAEKMNESTPVTYHIVPHDDDWAVKKEKASQASDVFSTKDQALEKGRHYIKTKNAKLVIHRQDGTIERVQHTGS
ncbi:DUF2188 domain-containing protein [Litchfieldia salsa]|uniref:Uncharacterized protein YdaT n=1 Tax=Litchfieldia salsa TaxID=930152 RepID=A0A1H0PUJ8_9BACI|nr:DUF2188 domain-containing protein [Litchfieldia salsa]SDP08188.1 Uncharacterized protein YdaT [Litchfieldia salsa]